MIDRVSLVAFIIMMAGPLGAQTPTPAAPAATESPAAAEPATAPAGPKLASPTAADPALPELSRVSQIRDLSPREAARGYPVRVTGVLTYYVTSEFRQFLQDDSAGIYIVVRDTANLEPQLAPGQKVEIEGFSGPGDYAPVLLVTHARILGQGGFPPPIVSTVQSLMTGSQDSQWVSLKGVIRSQRVEDGRTVLRLWTGDAGIQVSVPQAATAPAPIDFVDAAVEVRGVCSTTFNDRRRLQGVNLHVPDWTQVDVQAAGAKDPFELPMRPINELLEFHSGTSGLHRSRTSGTATLVHSDGSFFLQDVSGGMLVQPKDRTARIAAGRALEVVGFPAGVDRLPLLQEAITRPLNAFAPLAPVLLTPALSLNDARHATLVQLDARVIAHSKRLTEEVVTVQFGGLVTDAVLENEGGTVPLASVVPGSVVRLTGVYAAQLDDSRRVRSFRVLLRSPADVALVSRPPWWTLRNTLWVAGGLAVVLFGTLTWVGLLRKQVRRRTVELSGEVEERKQREVELEKTHKQLVAVSRQAGMAEIATNVLHNVGNVLNSVNVSAGLVADGVKKSKAASLGKVAALMREHESDIGVFISTDPTGRQLPAYLMQLSEHLVVEQGEIIREVDSLVGNIEHIKEIVSMQQSYANVSGTRELVDVRGLVDDSLRMNVGALGRHGVKVVREFGEVPMISVDKHKVLQILINLVRNSKHACQESGREERQITLRVSHADHCVRIEVDDNGLGIPPENLTHIFNHGFTTRKDGHGFGLHSGALAAAEMGGSLSVHSDGPGHGAVFILELPCQPQESAHG